MDQPALFPLSFSLHINSVQFTIMIPQNKITLGVELEFLVPFLLDREIDPAPSTSSENRPVTRAPDPQLAFDAIQLDIYTLLKKHNIPVENILESTCRTILSKRLPRHWCVDQDASVTERQRAFGYSWAGVELRSPVLIADSASYSHVSQVVTLLRDHFRIRVNQTTGFHVHVGMGVDPLPPRVVHRLAQLLWCADGMLSGLHPPERTLGPFAPSIRLQSNLAWGDFTSWQQGQKEYDDREDYRKPPRRRTRRYSINEGPEIRDRIWSDPPDQFLHLGRYAEASAAKNPDSPVEDHRLGLEGQDERDFLFSLRAAHNHGREAALDAHHNEGVQRELFGAWNLLGQEDGSDAESDQVDQSWVVETETMVSTTWAELMDYYDDLISDSPSSIDLQPRTGKGKSIAVPGQGHDDTGSAPGDGGGIGEAELFSNVRKNPFEDPGARSRHLEVEGIDTPEEYANLWLTRDNGKKEGPIPLEQGLLYMTDPALFDDTRRVAFLVSSVADMRCNYNFNSYGFPTLLFKKPIMTIEFREATGSMDPAWTAVWPSICAGIVEFCLAAEQEHFVEVLMRVFEAEKNETMVREGRGDPNLLGYDVVSFLADISLEEEASYVDNVIGKGDKNAFWFPCNLVRRFMIGWGILQFVGDGVGVLPPVTTDIQQVDSADD